MSAQPSKKKRTQSAEVGLNKPELNMNKKQYWLRWVIAAVATLTIVVIISILLNGGIMPEHAKMETYLKNKYGKEFIVENYRIEGSGLGMDGDPTADAYPRNNTELRFEVWDTGNYKMAQHMYKDNFVNAVWSAEKTRSLADEIKKIFVYMPEYRAIVGFSGELDSYQNVPNFKEALKKYSSNISLELRIKLNKAIDVNTQGDQIWASIGALRETGLESLRLYYCGKDDPVCIVLNKKELKAINTRDDLARYLKGGE